MALSVPVLALMDAGSRPLPPQASCPRGLSMPVSSSEQLMLLWRAGRGIRRGPTAWND